MPDHKPKPHRPTPHKDKLCETCRESARMAQMQVRRSRIKTRIDTHRLTRDKGLRNPLLLSGISHSL